jgi:hypothetical protein
MARRATLTHHRTHGLAHREGKGKERAAPKSKTYLVGIEDVLGRHLVEFGVEVVCAGAV